MKTTILTTAALLLSLTSVSAKELSHVEKVNALPVIGNFLTKRQTTNSIDTSHYAQVNNLPVIGNFVEERKETKIETSHYAQVNKLPVIGHFMKDTKEASTTVYASEHLVVSN